MNMQRSMKNIYKSVFQPIISLLYRRAVGFEALIRDSNADDSIYSTEELFSLSQ